MPTFQDVLAEEKQIVSAITDSAVRQAGSAIAEAAPEDSYGLAFSGGGIRSATFNLGILQGLAQAKLLPTNEIHLDRFRGRIHRRVAGELDQTRPQTD